MLRKLLTFIISFSAIVAIAQTTITGIVFDEYLEPFPGAIITSPSGSTTSNFEGEFSLEINKFPVTISISSIGYATEEIIITNANSKPNIILKEAYALNQIVMSASRTPERIIESPVSIERMSTKDFKNSSSVNFYENIGNLKGIDVLSNSLTIKNIVSNRGFANTENTRFVQIVDGTETTLPFINYSLGNTLGLNELDVESIEILPGAASALYGPNALNGILLMNSKNPYDYEGISSYIKYGYTNQNNRATNDNFGSGSADFVDVGIRMAHKFNDKFAAKATFSYTTGEEWHATDTRNTTEQGGVIKDGDRSTDPGYDGLNVYGDEINQNLINLGIAGESLGLLSEGTTQLFYSLTGADIEISREGYNEIDLIDTSTKSASFDASIHYRPWANNDLEIILSTKHNVGDNILHGSNRYSQKNGKVQQYRLEFKAEQFFLRGYYTKNKANLIDPRLTAFRINESFKSDTEYYVDYLTALSSNGFDFNAARESAEAGKPLVGTNEFNSLKTRIQNLSVDEGGSSLKDKSGFYHIDGNYNFNQLIDFADIQLGGSFRRFELNSNGQIYTDDNDIITFNEFGIYTQLQKKLLEDDRLGLTLTARYDKSKNFDGNFSPRTSITYAVGQRKDHNFRLSYQTGFRNPTTQDQYASINLGDRTILGSVEENLERESSTYNIRTSLTGETATLTGITNVKNNSYTLASVENFLSTTREDVGSSTATGQAVISEAIFNNAELLEKAEFDFVKPETVKTIELGYRGATKLASKLFEFDIAGYYNTYKNFITQKAVWSPLYGTINDDLTAPTAVLLGDARRYVIRTNTNATVNSYGITAGFVTKILGDFNFGANYAFADYEDDGRDTQFKAAYNTPKHKVKVSIGNDKLFKNFGFKTDIRWQDRFLYESVFIDAFVGARTILDAQINYTIPTWKSTVKIGGTNLGGQNYTSVPGTGTVGSQYYVSWILNN